MKPRQNNPQGRPDRGGLLGDAQTIIINGSVVVLLVLGIGGLIYNAFKPGGWLGRYVGGALDGGAGSILMGLLGLLIGGYMIKRWFDGVDAKSSRGDLLLYVGIGLGLFYGYQLVVNGSL
ncbi:MAG: hypothetical protein IPK20_01155 [Betaproteobacteria bacterium]|nr:hypothetical protein [Betaproteobacteria bacterium]